MPELPEVEAVRRRLCGEVLGATIQTAHLTGPAKKRAAALRGCRIETVTRRGKNLLLGLSGDLLLRVHLGMTGNFYALDGARPRPPATRAWLALEDGRSIVLEDPRKLGRIELLDRKQAARLDCELGPEPLSEDLTPERLAALAARSRAPIKLFLMDQKRIAGLGNIYAAEALFRAGIHPATPAGGLGRRRLHRLHAAIKEVLNLAIQSACSAYSGPGRFDARETFPLAVYGREGLACPRCGRRIRRIRQAGRSTYFCPRCQR